MSKKVKDTTVEVIQNAPKYDDIQVKDISAEAASYQIVETEILLGQCDNAFRYLLMTSKDSLLISGIGSCGKTTLVKYIAKRIVLGKCPKKLEDSIILEISKTDFPEEFELILDYFILVGDLCERMGYDKVIFVLDNVDEFSSELVNRFGEIIEGIKDACDFSLLKFIATADITLSSDDNLSINNVSNSIETVAELMYKNMVKVLWPQIIKYQEAHNVFVSKEMAYKIVSYVDNYASFSASICDYKMILEHLEEVIIIAAENGDKSVNISHIKKLFTVWDKSSTSSKPKCIIDAAKHEAGHALVELCHPEKYSVQGINGMLADAPVGGVCQHAELLELGSRKDVVIEIASSLAGRVMSGCKHCGDSKDLNDANDIARRWVLTCGCGKHVGEFVSLEDEKWMLNASEKMREAIEDEVRELLHEGEAYCKKLYKKHKKFHKLLSREIEKKFILTRSEILKLWKDYLKQSKKKKKKKK